MGTLLGTFQENRVLRRCQLLSFQRLQRFVEKSIRNSYQGPNPEEDTKNLPGIFNSQFAVTSPFFVNENCIGCGMCEAGCPKKAIEMQDGKPVWIMDHCYLCSACMNIPRS